MTSTRLNLVVIRSVDLEQAQRFYEELGLTFVRHSHGNGPEHLASEHDGMVFEIYPNENNPAATTKVRIGFLVAELDRKLLTLKHDSLTILSEAQDSPWGRRAVIQDPDGHKIELIES